MTAYTCKRLCCSVEYTTTGSNRTALTLNGVAETVRGIADRHDIREQSVRRRLDNRSCLARPRQLGNRNRREPTTIVPNLTSDSDRLAAQFLRMRRIAA